MGCWVRQRLGPKDEYASRASLFGTESPVACVADQPPGAASLDWLQHAGYKVHGPNFDARETLFAEFNGIYSAVRFYDGTRVEDPAPERSNAGLPFAGSWKSVR
jgi:hypothetical protein